MPERRAALLMFHRYPEVCRGRAWLLRELNPDVAVHGLYGGEVSGYAAAARALEPVLDSLGSCPLGDGRWRWQHTDLVIQEWYRTAGQQQHFDVLHIVQWDLLLFASLAVLYRHVPPGAVALSGITALERIAAAWHWTRNEPHRTETAALLHLARQSWGFQGVPKACLGPGAALPRAFLERLAAESIPGTGHDEVRLPLFAELFGHELVDTGFYPHWFDEESERLFNANGGELTVAAVKEELERGPRRAFHPCRESFDEPTLAGLLAVVRQATDAPQSR
jgi:hypothetical protein